MLYVLSKNFTSRVARIEDQYQRWWWIRPTAAYGYGFSAKVNQDTRLINKV